MIRYSSFMMFILATLILFIQSQSATSQYYHKEIRTLEHLVEDKDQEIVSAGLWNQQTEDRYRESLVGIVNTVYERDIRSTGGYEIDAGDEVSAIYEAIINTTFDYKASLNVVANYFDARAEYLDNLPTIWPVEYGPDIYVTSGYGMRYDPITGRLSFHPAMDIAGPMTTAVIATADGEVGIHYPAPDGYWKGEKNLGGYIVIDHGFGYETRYGHMRKTLVHEGDYVKRGQIIGYIGSTGTSTGPHVHYEVLKNGRWTNPMDLLTF